MFCPSCGNQNPDTAKFCGACAQPMPQAQAAPSIAPPPPPPPPSQMEYGSSVAPPPPAMPTSGVSAAAAVAPAYSPAAPPTPVPQPPAFSAGPPQAPYSPAAQKKSRGPLILVLVIVGVLIVVPFLIGFVRGFVKGFNASLEPTDQKVARLMREAAGLQPVRNSIFGEDKTDTKMRDLFKDIIRINKDYQDAVDKLDTSETAKLNTAESFADPSTVADGLKQLHAAYDLDAQQEQRMQEAMENFKHKFDDLSPSQRNSVVNAFNTGIAKVMPTRQRAISTEKAWVDSVDDVYDYAQSHHSDFAMSNGTLVIGNDTVREEFNTRVRTLNARRDEFLQAKNEFARMQGQTFQKMGVSRSQTGLH